MALLAVLLLVAMVLIVFDGPGGDDLGALGRSRSRPLARSPCRALQPRGSRSGSRCARTGACLTWRLDGLRARTPARERVGCDGCGRRLRLPGDQGRAARRAA